jgi:hypothetical protein
VGGGRDRRAGDASADRRGEVRASRGGPARARRCRIDRRPRDGRDARHTRPAPRARGQRRSRPALRRPVHDRARVGAGRLGRADPAPRRLRTPVACRRRQVLHRRSDRRRNRMALRAGHGGRGDAALLARSVALPQRGRDLRPRRVPVRDARHRRPGRARGARRVPGGRRGAAARKAPDRAHRDTPATRPAAVRRRGCGGVDAGAAHGLVRARPLRQLVAAARGGAIRTGTRVPDPIAARVRRARRPRLRSHASIRASVSPPHGSAVRRESASAGRTTTRRSTASPRSRATRRRPRRRSARRRGSGASGPDSPRTSRSSQTTP